MSIIVITVFLIISAFYVIEEPRKFVYTILIFQILTDTLNGFIDVNDFTSLDYLALGRAILILLFIIITFKYYRKTLAQEFWPILLFLILISFLGIFSSKFLISLSGIIKVIITYLMLPLGFYFVNSESKIKLLNNSMFWVIFIIVLNFIIANIFGIGQTAYSKNVEFYGGGFQVGALNTLALCLISTPALYNSVKINKRKILLLLVPMLSIFLLLSMKRAPIFAASLGIIIYFWFLEKKGNLIKVLLVFSTLVVLAYPLYADILEEQLFAREKQLQLNVIETERRYSEVLIVTNEILNAPNPITMLFGKEIFNTIGNYASGTFGPRALHTDIAQVLNGSGLVGFFLFIFIYIYIYSKFRKLGKNIPYKNISNQEFIKTLKPLFLALFIASLAISFSEGILAVTYRSVLFIYLGAILGTYKKIKIDYGVIKV